MKTNIINKIGILTSGGDSPGMNAAIRSIVKTSLYYNIKCYGIIMGYDGLINNIIKKLLYNDVKNIIHKGGTILKSARSEEFKKKSGRNKAYKNIIKNSFDALIVIGGDGTFNGAMLFSKEYNIPIIGIPGTIDNDIYGTDFTIGYDTAINTAVRAIDKIKDSAISHDRIFFIEVMGRNSGFIALNCGISTEAFNIIIPEKKFNLNKFFENINKNNKSSNIIIISEGNKWGGAKKLYKKTIKKFPFYDIRFTILGHIQRGGNPTCLDRILASKLGFYSVKALLNNKKNIMIGIKYNKIVFVPFFHIINKKHLIDKNLIKLSKIISM